MGVITLCSTPIAKSSEKINVLQTMAYIAPSGAISIHEKLGYLKLKTVLIY
jgi:hypothetical protein